MAFITTTEAGKRLGINRSRVLAIIKDPCPDCKKIGLDPKDCKRCHGTGMRLPAKRTRYGMKAAYLIDENDLVLVGERIKGWPKNMKRGKKQ